VRGLGGCFLKDLWGGLGVGMSAEPMFLGAWFVVVVWLMYLVSCVRALSCTFVFRFCWMNLTVTLVLFWFWSLSGLGCSVI